MDENVKPTGQGIKRYSNLCDCLGHTWLVNVSHLQSPRMAFSCQPQDIPPMAVTPLEPTRQVTSRPSRYSTSRTSLDLTRQGLELSYLFEGTWYDVMGWNVSFRKKAQAMERHGRTQHWSITVSFSGMKRPNNTEGHAVHFWPNHFIPLSSQGWVKIKLIIWNKIV